MSLRRVRMRLFGARTRVLSAVVGLLVVAASVLALSDEPAMAAPPFAMAILVGGFVVIDQLARLNRVTRSMKVDLVEVRDRQRRDTHRIQHIASSVGRIAPLVRAGLANDRRASQNGPSAPTTASAITFSPYSSPISTKRRSDLQVATILDEFSEAAFSYEWDQHPVTPENWRSALEAERIHLLFVESAWNGNGGSWRYHLTGPTAPRPPLVELVEWCRSHDIPTVFWNKEDPIHYEEFLDSARLFDIVFTTDSDTIEAYKRDLGHDRVYVLPFAAQPAMHNPIRQDSERASRDIAFGGMYFTHRHAERREQLDMLLAAALEASEKMDLGLEIFSRQLGGDPRYQFPERFASRVVGSLDYEQMLTAYRRYKVFLNVNTIVQSPTMCARRIFEISASGTPVVSTPNPAIDSFFESDEVVQVDDATEAAFVLRALVRNSEQRDRIAHLAQRRIWRSHTYGHRVDRVLGAANVTNPEPVRRRTVSALVSTNRPSQLEHIVGEVAKQRDVDVELVLLTHGFEYDRRSFSELCARLGVGDWRLLNAPASQPLGRCLNELVSAADGELVAKMDDDDEYAPYYLLDQVHTHQFSGATVVGKHAHYMHLEASNMTILRFPEHEHRYVEFVSGPTILTERATLVDVPFPEVPRGEDSGFLRAIRARGGRIYSGDRFNFVQRRRASSSSHTWAVSDAELLANSDVVAAGFARDHVMI